MEEWNNNKLKRGGETWTMHTRRKRRIRGLRRISEENVENSERGFCRQQRRRKKAEGKKGETEKMFEKTSEQLQGKKAISFTIMK